MRIRKKSYQLFNYSDPSGNTGPICFVGIISSLDPFIVENEGIKIELKTVSYKDKFNIGDLVRVYVRLSFSEKIPFGVPDIIRKINEDSDLYLKNLKKYIGEYYGKISIKKN